MDTVPVVPKCFGMFPPKYGTYLISLCGLGMGGCGLSGVVLYGLVEDSVVAHFLDRQPVDSGMKKAVLLIIGMTSLLLFCASFLLFVGLAFKSTGSLLLGVWILFAMCMLLITASIVLPISCFFIPDSCVIKKFSAVVLTLAYITITIFLWFWLYFVVVVFNHINAISSAI
ncbi:uncharacterized protein LOC124644874 [Helicoverpa zea]|uniref:uncharacterized protein LOC124644874 n=1 Tax=Helicoverpa zea TaxID=7113 RepID=UPI001F57A0D6|nr:uncharacterized protein LOC124644874 [Helicoverpa zea]